MQLNYRYFNDLEQCAVLWWEWKTLHDRWIKSIAPTPPRFQASCPQISRSIACFSNCADHYECWSPTDWMHGAGLRCPGAGITARWKTNVLFTATVNTRENLRIDLQSPLLLHSVPWCGEFCAWCWHQPQQPKRRRRRNEGETDEKQEESNRN